MADPTTAPVALRIRVADRVVVADVAGKSLRKARATIAEFGVDNVAVIIQGKLVGDAVIEAGLVAQPKAAQGASQRRLTTLPAAASTQQAERPGT